MAPSTQALVCENIFVLRYAKASVYKSLSMRKCKFLLVTDGHKPYAKIPDTQTPDTQRNTHTSTET